MSVAPEVIQKINVFAAARLVDRAARAGAHVVGRGISYGAVRGAAIGALRGSAAGALQGFREGRRIASVLRNARRFRYGARSGYSNARFSNSIYASDAMERNARLARAVLARATRAGRAGYAVGARAYNAQTQLGRSARTLVRAFNRQGRRVSAYWRSR